MGEVEDALAKMRAASDQWRESSREVAKNVATYHGQLIEDGVDAGDATDLTLGYQQFLLMTIFYIDGTLTDIGTPTDGVPKEDDE